MLAFEAELDLENMLQCSYWYNVVLVQLDRSINAGLCK